MVSLARLFPDPFGPVASFAEELFEILGSYFPIHFTHVRQLNASFLLLCYFCSSVCVICMPYIKSRTLCSDGD